MEKELKEIREAQKEQSCALWLILIIVGSIFINVI
jgi:hypothetical protein